MNNRIKYNGKEFIEMHGYDTYDYGARGMYPAIMRFTTIDPLAEKYYSVSPYAYCANNPIRFIDPNGMWLDDYTMDDDGDIKKVRETEDKFDMLYSKKDYEKGKKDNGLKLNKRKSTDKTILADLEKSSISQNHIRSSEVFKVFKFAADNSSVEWAFSNYKFNGNNRYAIWTSHNRHSVDPASYFGINNEVAHIHSHPSIMNDYKIEMESMGANWTPNNGGYFWMAPYSPIGNGLPDWKRVHDNKRNTREAVYFPRSHNLYRLRKGEWDVPLLLRNINRPNDLRFW